MADLVFSLLAAFNTVRLLRHAVWRDEMQAFTLAATSSTPIELFARLKYEGHPGLWHLILWIITRFTDDPVSMQIAHLVIALGVWILVWRASPFSTIEKFLLLLGYFLFWEYFVVSRNYALGVLLGFSFIALRIHRPEQRFWPWLLLGLLANTTVFGTIWSLGLGGFFAFRIRAGWRRHLLGIAIFAAFVALAVMTLIPAKDYLFNYPALPSFGFRRLDTPLRFVFGAFIPIDYPFLYFTLSEMGGVARNWAQLPIFVVPQSQLVQLVTSSPWLAIPILLFPAVACVVIVHDRLLVLEYVIIAGGILLFAELWGFAGGPRHYGYLFMALIGAVWVWRSRPEGARSNLWIVLLAISVVGGLTTLVSERVAWSESKTAALWLQANNFQDAFLIGSRDATTSPITGYLRRPLYYLECQCSGTFVKWSNRRKGSLKLDDLLKRTSKAMLDANKDEAIFISTQPFDLAQQKALPQLKFEELVRFPPSMVADESYVIYRVTREVKG